MDWNVVGALGEIVGAIAVIVTLGYLAIHMRQNTASVGASAFQVWAGSNQPASPLRPSETKNGALHVIFFMIFTQRQT